MFCSDPFDPAVIESVKRQKKGIATKNKVILDSTVTIIFAHII